MAFHFKSKDNFLFVIGASALALSTIAALFSIIGVSSLFSGELKTIAIMMLALEFAKVILASYLGLYWKKLTKLIRTYFITALLVLMIITSAGIFGYLSDAYQGTKGNYEQVDQSIKTEQIRLDFYAKEIKENESRLAELRNSRRSYQVQMDSLVSRNKSTYSTERALRVNDTEILDIRKKNTALNDSLSNIKLRIAEKEGINSSGKLGPLRFIATAFGTDMDTVVKYFIGVLVFVFDPLAILMFISIAIMRRKVGDEVLVESKDADAIKKPTIVDTKTGEYTLQFNEIDLSNKTDFWIPPPGVPYTKENEKKFFEFIETLKKEKEIPTVESVDNPASDAKIPETEPEVKKNEVYETGSMDSEPVKSTEVEKPVCKERVIGWHTANWRGTK